VTADNQCAAESYAGQYGGRLRSALSTALLSAAVDSTATMDIGRWREP
jgi:hypothetical protein